MTIAHNNSRNSSTVKPACRNMSARVPFASELCIGTTVRNTWPSIRFSSETWLPFCRNSTNPALISARTTRSPETEGSLVISLRDFDDGPEGSLAIRGRVRGAPSFEVKLDCLAEIGAGGLDVLPLRRNAELWAARDVPFIFFGDQGGKTVIHTRNRIRQNAKGQGLRTAELLGQAKGDDGVATQH